MSSKRNYIWFCADASDVPRVAHTEFPATVVVLGVGAAMMIMSSPHVVLQRLGINADEMR